MTSIIPSELPEIADRFDRYRAAKGVHAVKMVAAE